MDVSQAPVWLQAVVLGLVQGLCEFLPISSSGHLILVPELTHWKYLGKEFDVALHFGTLIAIVIYFVDDVKILFDGLLGLVWRVASRNWLYLSDNESLTLNIAVASLPAGLLGLLLKDWFEGTFTNMGSIALFLALFGILLGVAERAGTQCHADLKEVTVQGAAMMGCAQALALMPGVSRSGSTMTMALMLGLSRAQAARFSFLMALPITAAACLLKGLNVIKTVADTGQTDFFVPCVIGIMVSGLSGWMCIRFLLRYLRSHSFTPFIIYRLALATFLLAWMLAHR